MEDRDQMKPYIPTGKVIPEFTGTSIVMGILLAVVFGAANAYLGLRVGMTVSASIPAAVIAMGVIRMAMRRNSILESNMVQTVGSAGESVAAGAIFTLPALFLWAAEGKMERPGIAEITLVALLGGLLGVLFMVPLRNALIVREHGILPYPEGTACAEVLLAGEEGGAGALPVFAGMGLGGVFKFLIDGVRVVAGEVSFRLRGYAGEIGTQVYPAVLSVGYICGPKISSYMFAGSLVSWLVLIPGIVTFGSGLTLYPGTVPIGEMFEDGGASAIWGSYIRYIGAGALAAGGIISLVKSLPLIFRTFGDAVRGMRGGAGAAGSSGAGEQAGAAGPDCGIPRTEQDLNMRVLLSGIGVLTVLVWLLPVIPVTLLGAVIVVVFGFFFAAVSSRMVGLVGSSNNPVSGMAIATLLFTTILLKMTGDRGAHGMQGAIAIGSIICIVAAIAGDTSQDLKTGYLLGATPKKQQIGELIGVTAASLAIGGVLYLLDMAWGFGTEELGAPQAMLMKMIIEGVMENSLPWTLVFMGAFLAIAALVVGVPVLPFAIGVYLPVQLNACIMIGGLIRLAFDRMEREEKEKERIINDGILYCSGMIAGEGLVGILLALLAVFGADQVFDLSERLALSLAARNAGGLLLFGVLILSVFRFSVWRRRKE